MDRYERTKQAFDQRAEWYEEVFMQVALYNDTYDRFLQLLGKPGASLLEIGCGPGNITRYLLDKDRSLHITATDIAPNMIRRAQQHNPSAECLVLDCRDIARLNTAYDGIIGGFCLPYLTSADTARLIGDCSRLLAEDGLLYLSAIEGGYERSGFEWNSRRTAGTYVHYYDEPALRDMLQAQGFRIEAVMRKPWQKTGGDEDTHLVVIARKP